MPLLDDLRRMLVPMASGDPHAPYHTHYQLVNAAGETYRESGVAVVYFEDGPAIAKAVLLNRADPTAGWRAVKTGAR